MLSGHHHFLLWRKFAWVLVALLALLCSCIPADVQQKATFYADELWQLEIDIGFPSEAVALIEGSEAIQGELEKAVTNIKNQGGVADWSSKVEGEMVMYHISAKGQGLEIINDILFSGDAQLQSRLVNGKEQVFFRYNPTDLAFSYYELVISAGTILSTNGIQEGSHTIRWVNPSSTLEATFTPKSQFNLLLWISIPSIAFILLGIVWYSRHRQPATKQCSYCTAWISSKAQFCPYCGNIQGEYR